MPDKYHLTLNLNSGSILLDSRKEANYSLDEVNAILAEIFGRIDIGVRRLVWAERVRNSALGYLEGKGLPQDLIRDIFTGMKQSGISFSQYMRPSERKSGTVEEFLVREDLEGIQHATRTIDYIGKWFMYNDLFGKEQVEARKVPAAA